MKKKKTWARGRAKIGAEAPKIVTLKLTPQQYGYLKSTGNLSAEVRRLVDREMERRQ